MVALSTIHDVTSRSLPHEISMIYGRTLFSYRFCNFLYRIYCLNSLEIHRIGEERRYSLVMQTIICDTIHLFLFFNCTGTHFVPLLAFLVPYRINLCVLISDSQIWQRLCAAYDRPPLTGKPAKPFETCCISLKIFLSSC
jgi:hypothetical protein